MRIKKKIKVNEAAGWTGCKVISGSPDRWITSISTDSRTLEMGDFFIPVKGDNFNGHDFIFSAISSGAAGIVYDKSKRGKVTAALRNSGMEGQERLIIFEAGDTMDFLKSLASNYIRQFKVVTIGITGSLGKTTTKSMISSILEKGFNIVYTPENFNTEIGVSKTIFEIDSKTDFFIVELGMRGAGQIGHLAEISNVNVGAITSISGSHMEFFKSIEGLAAAKAEIAGPVEANRGRLFLNADDEMTPFIKKIVGSDIIEFGEDHGRDYNFISKGNDSRGRFSFDFLKGKTRLGDLRCSQPGFHNQYNGCLSAAICHSVGADIDMIREGLVNVKMEEHRMQILEIGGMTILDDCYNASPVSVRGALDTLSSVSEINSRRSVAILGDMLELGSNASVLHYDTGAYAAKKDIDVLITSGKLAKNICRGFLEENLKKKGCYHYKDKEALQKDLKDIVRTGDMVLIKGSRANKLEEIVSYLKKQ